MVSGHVCSERLGLIRCRAEHAPNFPAEYGHFRPQKVPGPNQSVSPPSRLTKTFRKACVGAQVDTDRYGGPGSQMVSNQFSRDWHTYLACEKKYIIVMLDGRGTGLKGRALRNPVQDRLGYYETMDQIAAAREMVKKGYVDRERIGIWGWASLKNWRWVKLADARQSYGGYMTLKVIEAMSGIFTLGSE